MIQHTVLISILETFLLLVISFAAGVLGTVSGGGGGVFTVPALVSTINENPQVLVGSVFLMYTVSSITGLVVYYRKGLVDVRTGVLLAIPTLPGVLLGALLSTNISEIAFKEALGSLVIILGTFMIFRPEGFTVSNTKQSDGKSQEVAELSSRKKRTITDRSGRVFEYVPNFLIGFVVTFSAGILNGLFGAGASVILIPATILFVKLPGHVAIASTRIVLTVLNITGLLAHIGTGLFNGYYAVLLSIGAVIGSFYGARIAFGASKTNLSKIVAIVFLLIGGYLIIASV